ncbi:MAG: YicC family protein [Rikenellaceae bacterium]|nr:YicC family protein [Rikenellaceae bacterium]
MTGFGKSEVAINGKTITAEIRSLNSKQLDLGLKTPAAYRELENDIRSLVSKRVVRGKVDLLVSVVSTEVATASRIDKPLFAAYIKQMNEALAYAGVEVDYEAIIPVVMKMPNVIQADTADASEEEKKAVMAAVEGAIDKLDAFRKQEGAILIADLLRRVDLIEQMRNEIIPFEAARTEAVRQRIREGIEKLGVEVDNNRLEQEMIFYIEKLDITEEKVRLENHCKYFREVANNEEQAGRKLGFIAQEMGREINTTGSKANQHDIQKLVVKMKDELEKIKEQVLNIL